MDFDHQPAVINLTRNERVWISASGIIVRTLRHELFGAFCQTLGTFPDRSATYIIPRGTRITSTGWSFEHRAEGGYVCLPPRPTPQPAVTSEVAAS